MQPFYTQYSNLLGEVEVGGIRKTPQLFQAACFTILFFLVPKLATMYSGAEFAG